MDASGYIVMVRTPDHWEGVFGLVGSYGKTWRLIDSLSVAIIIEAAAELG